MLGNLGRRLLRKPWRLALVGGLVVLLGAAFLLAQVDEASLFGVWVWTPGRGGGCVPLLGPCPPR